MMATLKSQAAFACRHPACRGGVVHSNAENDIFEVAPDGATGSGDGTDSNRGSRSLYVSGRAQSPQASPMRGNQSAHPTASSSSVSANGSREARRNANANTVTAKRLLAAEARVLSTTEDYFNTTGKALLEISEGRLYLEAGYASFALYVKCAEVRLHIKERQVYNLLAAARFVRLLEQSCPALQLPSSERQVRPLMGLGEEGAVRAWGIACATALTRDCSVSGALVRECVQRMNVRATREGSTPNTAAVGAGEHLTAPGMASSAGNDAAPAQFFVSSKSNEWYSPQWIIKNVHTLFGGKGIALDPCSSPMANERVRARSIFTLSDDSLGAATEWKGTVYMNPPYGLGRGGESLQGQFVSKCISEYQKGNVTEAVMLLKAAVGYSWFNCVYEFPVCFLSARLSYKAGDKVVSRGSGVAQGTQSVGRAGIGTSLSWTGAQQNPHGSVVVYLGPNIGGFCALFGSTGHIPGFNMWAYKGGCGDGGSVP
jgi:DNA N-6-adenine-methyltransferase (Dam)